VGRARPAPLDSEARREPAPVIAPTTVVEARRVLREPAPCDTSTLPTPVVVPAICDRLSSVAWRITNAPIASPDQGLFLVAAGERDGANPFLSPCWVARRPANRP
jgi:hypothetical protein